MYININVYTISIVPSKQHFFYLLLKALQVLVPCLWVKMAFVNICCYCSYCWILYVHFSLFPSNSIIMKTKCLCEKNSCTTMFFFKSLSNLVIIQLSTNCNFYIIYYIDHDFVFCNFSLYMVFILFYALLFKIVD